MKHIGKVHFPNLSVCSESSYLCGDNYRFMYCKGNRAEHVTTVANAATLVAIRSANVYSQDIVPCFELDFFSFQAHSTLKHKRSMSDRL